MRNTTMKDKLETILSSGVSTEIKVESDNAVVWRGSRQKTATKKKPAPAFIPPPVSQNPFENAGLVGPRYIVPPKRKNPFAVHVYSVASTEESSIEAQLEEAVLPEPEAVVVPKPVPEAAPVPAPKIFVVQDTSSHKPVTPTLTPTLTPTVISHPPEKVVEEIAEIAEEKPAVEEEAVVEELAAPLLEMPVVESAPEEKEEVIAEDAPPTISLPPNLSWLNQQTPFGGELTQMVDKLRSAKTNVGFTLEQSISRQKDLRSQIAGLQERLDKEEYFGEQQKDNLKQLDEVIAACALVAEQSAPVESILQQLTSAVHKKHPTRENGVVRRSYKLSADDKTVCHSIDVIEFFNTHPGRNWSVQEIVAELPTVKRPSAKQNLYAHLSYMVQKGTLQRVGAGVYRALES